VYKHRHFGKVYLIALFVVGGVLFFPKSSKAVIQTPDPSFSIIASTSITSGSSSAFGRPAANNNVVGFKYVVPHDSYLCSVNVGLSKNGSPTDSVQMQIKKNGTTFPGDDDWIVSDNVALSGDMTTSRQDFNFSFGQNCWATPGNITLWIGLVRTGAESGANYYNLYNDTTTVTFFPDSSIDFKQWGDRNGIYVPDTFPASAVFGIDEPGGFDIEEASASCDGYSSTVQKEACIILKTLFVPSSDILNEWTEVRNDIAEHKPISYFYGVTELFGSSVASDSDNFISFGTRACGR